MSESQITKKALAMSIKELMNAVPLSKISIQQIVDNCGINRKTFYYHFKDKYDLVDWIYYTEVNEILADSRHYNNWTDGACITLTYLVDNKQFYVNAFSTPGQNSFDKFFFEFCCKIIMDSINDLSFDMVVSNTNKKFIADFYANAFLGLTKQWIDDGMKESPKVLVDGISKIIEGTMPHALKRYCE